MAAILSTFARGASAFALAMALASCASFPGGGYGDPGGYGGYPGRDQRMQIVSGAVDDFDARSGRLLLSSDGYPDYGTRGVEVRLDRDSRLFYQGRELDPAGLERGDRVRIEVIDDGRRLWARSIEVTHNVRDGGGYPGGAAGGFEGAVRYVDLGRRVIEITRGGYAGRVEQVRYDERTRFDYRGQRVEPRQLEPGDIVRIDARQTGNGWLADAVWVTVDARSR